MGLLCGLGLGICGRKGGTGLIIWKPRMFTTGQDGGHSAGKGGGLSWQSRGLLSSLLSVSTTWQDGDGLQVRVRVLASG
jgi:hypothetical protein